MDIKRYLLDNYDVKELNKTISKEIDGVDITKYSTNEDNIFIVRKRFNNQLRFFIEKDFEEVDCYPVRESTTHKELLTQNELQQDALAFCKQYYPRLDYTFDHEYLKAKKISGRFKANDDYIVIPVKNIDGEIVSLQYINSTEKKFKANTSPFKSGGFYTSEECLKSKYKYIYICEGFADNLTIKKHLIEKKSLVVSALSSGNIKETYKIIRERFTDANIVLVLDTNDTSENYTDILSKDSKKLGVIEIITENRQVKDINDLYILDTPVGYGVSKKCIAIINDYKNIFFELNILGADVAGNLYFNSTENNTLIKFNPRFTKRDCKQIAVDNFWLKNFPRKNTNKDGDISYSIDWNKAIEWLEVETRKKPMFDISNIVSSGISYNYKEKSFICNPGQGTDDVIGSKEKGKIYIKGIRYPNPHNYNPIYLEDDVIDLFSSIALSHPKSGVMFFAWLAQATICGGLPWRMIGYLTGGSNSGKSTMLNKFAKASLGEFSFNVVGDTSYAGLKRGIGLRGVPTLVEEFEFLGKFAEVQKEKFLQVVRNSCSMESGFKTYQVGEGGVVEAFECRSSFLIASIKISMSEPAILNRTVFFTPEGHKTSSKQYKELLDKLRKINLDKKFKGYYSRLFMNGDKLLEFYESNLSSYKAYNGKSIGHFSKNMAMTNAIIKTLTKDFGDKYTLSKQDMLAHSSQGIEEDGSIVSEDTEARVLLDKLKESIISFQGPLDREEDSLDNFIQRIKLELTWSSSLSKTIYDRCGVYVNSNQRVLLNFKHSTLNKLCRGIIDVRGLRKLLKNEFNLETTFIRMESKKIRAFDITDIL